MMQANYNKKHNSVYKPPGHKFNTVMYILQKQITNWFSVPIQTKDNIYTQHKYSLLQAFYYIRQQQFKGMITKLLQP